MARNRLFPIVFLWALIHGSGNAYGWILLPPSPHAQCQAAIAGAEQGAAIPSGLMAAIGVVESGRRDPDGRLSAYPWTINAEGVGSYYATKAEAIAAVVALRAQGVRSIDVGCMQVNLVHHSSAFATLDEAFDPAINARYAASFLQRLLTQTGSWPAATAGYHSMTPELGEPYARRVLAIWKTAPAAAWPAPTGPGLTGPGLTGPGLTGPGMMNASAGNGLGLSSPAARIMRLPTTAQGGTTIMLAGTSTGLGTGSGMVGRSLDAYRAAAVPITYRIGPGRG